MPDPGPTLEALGWTPTQTDSLGPPPPGQEVGRVAVEDKHYYTVISPRGELISQISGKLLHQTPNTADLPKVGDWVLYSPLPREQKGVIHAVLPRKTRLSRKVPGREVEEQVLATNINLAFAVQALDLTFNPALLQRHLVMILESGAKPVVVLNKADLCANIPGRVDEARAVAAEAPLVVVSAKTTDGLGDLAALIQPGETVVFIGSSGVGKSSLINDLCGEDIQATLEVREKDAKGRHTTTWRELIMLPGGGLVIDTPGMREFQMWMADEGMRDAFADLEELAVSCHFRDCTHTVESRCAIETRSPPERSFRNALRPLHQTAARTGLPGWAHSKHSWIQRRRNAA
ncbi:MAG: ribosome small subunit-dependent GTPase A [Verrucomicrobiota bacterium]